MGDDDDTQEQAFKDMLEELKSKSWTPLMDAKDIQDAEHPVLEAAQSRETAMKTASTLFNVPKYLEAIQHKEQYVKAKVDFYTSRYNGITTSDIRNLIPAYIPSDDKVYLQRTRFIAGRASAHAKHSLVWLYRVVKNIVKTVDACIDSCGLETKNFFKELTDEQRIAVLGAVFDQYPLWPVTQFRDREAGSVDFKQIWSPVDSPDRVALRSYYRLMFVGMADATYQVHFLGALGGDMEELKKAWREFPACAAVEALGLGGPESLPLA